MIKTGRIIEMLITAIEKPRCKPGTLSTVCGVIWKMITPYCTCSEPLKKWQYITGGAMPTLILGGGLTAAAAACGSFPLLILAVIMIFGGGGDIFIILKMLMFAPEAEDVVYYDHPYECGVVAFIKKGLY